MKSFKVIPLVLFVIVFWSSSAFGQTMSCEELRQYRNQLPALYHSSIQQEKQRFANLSNYKGMLDGILSEMNKDKQMLNIGTFVQLIKTTCDGLNNTLSLATVSSRTLDVLERRAQVAASELARKDLLASVQDAVLSNIPVIKQFYSLAENINNLQSFVNAEASLRIQISQLKTKIANLEQQIKSSTPNTSALNQYTTYIDNQLKVICK